MTVRLGDVVAHLDAALEIDRFKDYAVNGLQVEGSPEIDTVVCGVSATLELFARAAEIGADLVVVHHGLIWGGGLAQVVGPTARRLGLLLENGISLAAYHLPLDAHPRLGNNVGLCDALALGAERQRFGEVKGQPIGLAGSWREPLAREDAIGRVAGGVLGGRRPPFSFPFGPAQVRKVGVCSGAAADLLEEAARIGCDMFVTGELAERAVAVARELQITLVAAGHHATEVFGPQRLADEIAHRFAVAASFIDVPSPV